MRKPLKPLLWYEQWHEWFAWRPVRVGDSLVWLERVERRYVIHLLPGHVFAENFYRDLAQARVGESNSQEVS